MAESRSGESKIRKVFKIFILFAALPTFVECQITSVISPKVACVGDDVDIDWVYDDAANFLSVTWTYINSQTSAQTIIMEHTRGGSATVSGIYNVAHKTNGGIKLTQVTLANSGSYKISVSYISATPPDDNTVAVTVNDCSSTTSTTLSTSTITTNTNMTNTAASTNPSTTNLSTDKSLDTDETTTPPTKCTCDDCKCKKKCQWIVILSIIMGVLGILLLLATRPIKERIGRKTALVVVSIGILCGVTSFVLGIVVQAIDCCEYAADCCKDLDCCKNECKRNWIENVGAAFIAIGALVVIAGVVIFYRVWFGRMGPGNNAYKAKEPGENHGMTGTSM